MTDLARAYANYNRRYFGGRLPRVAVRWAPLPREGYGIYNEDGIVINLKLRGWPRTWHITLLHEMAHVATDSEVAQHGIRWHREMRRLSRAGAFDALW